MMKGKVCTSKSALLPVMLVLSLTLSATGLQYGFGQVDYTRSEPDGVMVEVIRRQENVGNLVLTVTPFSYSQFDSMGLTPPPELPIASRPDPAEFDINGVQDYIEDSITVTFPPSNNPAEETMNVFIPFIDDDTNEPLFEGFYVRVTIDEVLSNPADVANAETIRNGVALIRIEDDDMLFLTFEQSVYEVREGDGMINNLVLVQKQDGRASEQILPIQVQLQLGSAIRGADYQIPPVPIELEFLATESRLPVPFNTFDDAILEGPENFILFLTVPANPVPGYGLGTISSTIIRILDNDVGTIGFEMRSYTAQEESGMAEVCLVILEPADLANISPQTLAFFFVETVDGTAIGGVDYDPLIAGSLGTDVFLDRNNQRMCVTINLIDDTLNEGSESLMVRFNMDPHLGTVIDGNFRFDPNITEVIIEDLEVTRTVQSIIPTPTPTATRGGATPVLTPVPTMGFGGDPHFSIKLPSGEFLCFSVQGEHGFVFNLISNPQLQMNALFVPDALRSEVTWFGSIGVVIKNVFKKSNSTELRFVANEKMVYIGDGIKLNAKNVEKLTFSRGKLTISEAKREKQRSRPEIQVHLEDHGLDFIVHFTKDHLDMVWNNIAKQPEDSHGIIGQFFRPGVEIDKTRRLLLLPEMEPIAVMRKPVWHFMEREEKEDQLCWVAMNPGYQGKKLIEGHYLDYVVNDVLSEKFEFKSRQ